MKTPMPLILMGALTVLSGSSAAAHMPPECAKSHLMAEAKPFVDPHLTLSQLTPAEAARYHRVPAKGTQRRVFLVVRGYLRLCEQVIDGRMKPQALSADDIDRVEAVGKRYLAPAERAIFQRAAARIRRAAFARPPSPCEEALIHAVDGPPPRMLAEPTVRAPHGAVARTRSHRDGQPQHHEPR